MSFLDFSGTGVHMLAHTCCMTPLWQNEILIIFKGHFPRWLFHFWDYTLKLAFKHNQQCQSSELQAAVDASEIPTTQPLLGCTKTLGKSMGWINYQSQPQCFFAGISSKNHQPVSVDYRTLVNSGTPRVAQQGSGSWWVALKQVVSRSNAYVLDTSGLLDGWTDGQLSRRDEFSKICWFRKPWTNKFWPKF